MHTSIKMLILSALLAIPSLAFPLSGTNIVWVDDASFSFMLQVAFPHLGIAVSSLVGGYAGAQFLRHSREQSLHNLAEALLIIAIVMLIGGLFIGNVRYAIYVFAYSLLCPPMIGLGIMKLSERVQSLTRRRVSLTLIVVMLLLSISLLCTGITSTDWIMIVDFGTSLRVLFGAMIGGFVATLNANEPMRQASEMTS